ncbi:MAG: hypothetical protein JWM19_924 [Actinomycetia bacterium]|nr:hypothetical protein [Actinomycetes bacterium]
MNIPAFVLTSRAEGATLAWGVFPGLQEAKDRAEEVSLHGLSWRVEIPHVEVPSEVRPVYRADFEDVMWRIEEFTLATGSRGGDAAILMAARDILRARFRLFTAIEQAALAGAAGEISAASSGSSHDHSWAASMDEVRACCPDHNPALAETGTRCPGDPRGEERSTG